jgi:hypothetical protein
MSNIYLNINIVNKIKIKNVNIIEKTVKKSYSERFYNWSIIEFRIKKNYISINWYRKLWLRENQLKADERIASFNSRSFADLLYHNHKKKVATARAIIMKREGPVLKIKLVVWKNNCKKSEVVWSPISSF